MTNNYDVTSANDVNTHGHVDGTMHPIDAEKGDGMQMEFLPKNGSKRAVPDNVGPSQAVTIEEDDVSWVESDDGGEQMEPTSKAARFLGSGIQAMQRMVRSCVDKVNKVTKGHLWTVVFLVAYLVYFVIALRYRNDDEGSHRLLGCTVIGFIIWTRHIIRRVAKQIWTKLTGSEESSEKRKKVISGIQVFIKWFMYLLLAVVAVYAIISEGKEKPGNLRALPGLFCFVLLCLLLSTNASQINWHTIYWSLGMQFLMAMYALKWQKGKDSIVWIQDRLNEFFANSKIGSTLLFGETYTDHQLIFGALPSFVYTNAAVYILYYLGAMQLAVKWIGNFLNFVLHTSPVESISVAAGIFLEGLASLAALRPFLASTTKSQLFLIMTSTFASLGGAYLSLLASISVQLEYLIAAMVISAPATFCVCKLLVPETRKTKEFSEVNVGDEEKNKYINLLDAAQAGAVTMLPVISHAAVNAFASWSFIAWINSTFIWFGDRVGIHRLTLEFVSSYVFYPASLAMGIEPEDCRQVAMLLGYRVTSTNLVAFIKMMQMKGNRFQYQAYMAATNYTGPVSHDRDDVILDLWNTTLPDGFISERSEAIAVYSLAGFSSLISAALLLGILYALIPKRKRWVAKATMPALLAGNIANCMTGCFASLFY